MPCKFDSLVTVLQLQGSWHIMQLTGILAAEIACLYKVRKYSLSMSRNDPKTKESVYRFYYNCVRAKDELQRLFPKK